MFVSYSNNTVSCGATREKWGMGWGGIARENISSRSDCNCAAMFLSLQRAADMKKRPCCCRTYFSSTNCFWYSSYSSLVIPAALAGSDGVASSSLSPPPPRPIPDRGFPIMLLIKKAISSCVVSVYAARTRREVCRWEKSPGALRSASL